MNTRRLVIWIAFLAVFAMAARVSMDTDTWWHLRAGQWMLDNRSVLQADPFSYTRMGESWLYPGWLVQIPMALVYRAFGPAGLNLWVAGMVTLAFAFVWRAMDGGVFLRSFVLVLGVAASGVYWAARPYMVTFLLAAVFLWIFEDHRWARRDRLWWLPVGMALWANSHGGFAVGFILWGVYLAGAMQAEFVRLVRHLRAPDSGRAFKLERATRKFLLVGGAMLLAVMLNPSGPVMLLYPFKTVGITALQDFIQEWQSPNFHDAQVQPFAWLLLLTLGAAGASRRGLALVDFLLVAGFAYLGLLAGRNIALFALVAPVVLSRHAGPMLEGWAHTLGVDFRVRTRKRVPRLQGWLNRALVGVIFFAVLAKVLLVIPTEANWTHFREILPVEAAAFIQREQPEGRVFNSYNWGAYLLWALPEYPVFVDGRTDLYNDEIINQWFSVARAEDGWEAVLDEWGVNMILLEPGMPVVTRLEAAGWRLLYVDEIAVLYGR